VYVDSESSKFKPGDLLKLRGQVHQVTHRQADHRPQPAARARVKDETLDVVYERFRRHVKRAREIHRKTRVYIDKTLEDVRLGHGVDTAEARRLVTDLAQRVVDSADALVWLTHLKSRDEYTATHCVNVCVLALTVGRFLGLKPNALFPLGLGALLHDLGKLRVPQEILNKPGRLTEEEFQLMKAHPELGHLMLRDSEKLPPESLDIVLHHHERLDGRGYPHGLSGFAIDRLTKIVSIVDVYDAITSDRAYHDAISPASALKNMYSWAPNNFEPELIEGFIRCIGIYPTGSLVRLNSGEIGVIIASNEGHRLRPLILLVLDQDQKPYSQRHLINLGSPIWEGQKNRPHIAQVLEPGSFGIDTRPIIEAEIELAQQSESEASGFYPALDFASDNASG
jgi:HD-GYP domain-containing protein (c-di-GMP phosphodiesterase class II)